MNTEVKSVFIDAQHSAVCSTRAEDLVPPPDGIVIETKYSCISAGTETFSFTGLDAREYPRPVGVRAIGRVLETGPDCAKLQPGDLVFSHTPHASHAVGRLLVAKLPDDLERPETAMIGMASVALCGIRVAAPEIGDRAVVTGAGLVGQFVAQLLQLSGVQPILIDRVEQRLEIARTCGIKDTVNAGREDAAQAVTELTGGRGAEHVFECTGAPAVVEQAIAYCAQSGKFIQVGSPRGEHQADLTAFVNHAHIWCAHGDVTIMGAHEWKIPIYPTHGVKHSQLRNMHLLGELYQSERLKLGPLLTTLCKPEDCQQAFEGLVNDKENHLGVVFDWTTG
jgi:threonine dehydrogenase-like Zn-dependent dehydrogenase